MFETRLKSTDWKLHPLDLSQWRKWLKLQLQNEARKNKHKSAFTERRSYNCLRMKLFHIWDRTIKENILLWKNVYISYQLLIHIANNSSNMTWLPFIQKTANVHKQYKKLTNLITLSCVLGVFSAVPGA